MPFKVLIVDDEADFVELLVDRLNLHGLDAHGVLSGQEALNYLSNHETDVVLLDMRMPGLDGLGVLKEIKIRQPNVEVILLSGHGNVDQGLQALQLGAFEYLIKPVRPDDLLAIIKEAYEKRMIKLEKATSPRDDNCGPDSGV